MTKIEVLKALNAVMPLTEHTYLGDNDDVYMDELCFETAEVLLQRLEKIAEARSAALDRLNQIIDSEERFTVIQADKAQFRDKVFQAPSPLIFLLGGNSLIHSCVFSTELDIL